MKHIAFSIIVALAILSIGCLVGCGKQSSTTREAANDPYAEVKKKLKAFDSGEIDLAGVTDTGPGKTDTVWMSNLVGYYLTHSNEFSVKMKLPISRCFAGMKKYPDAVQLAQEYVNSYSNDWQAWRILGGANFQLGDFQASVNAYTNAVRLGDDVNCDILAVAALKADRMDVFPLIVPKLLAQMNSPEPKKGWRLEVAMLLGVYALKANQEEVFVKALAGLDPGAVVSRDDLHDVVKSGCKKFRSKEAEALCEKLNSSAR